MSGEFLLNKRKLSPVQQKSHKTLSSDLPSLPLPISAPGRLRVFIMSWVYSSAIFPLSDCNCCSERTEHESHFPHELQLFDEVNINKNFTITALPLWGLSYSPFTHTTHLCWQGKLCAGGSHKFTPFMSSLLSCSFLCLFGLIGNSLLSVGWDLTFSDFKLFFSVYFQVTLSDWIQLILIILGILSVLNSYLKGFTASQW